MSNEALYGAIKAEARRQLSRGRVLGRTFEQLALEAIAVDEEEYLARRGYPRGAMPHATFTRSTMNVSGRALRGFKKEHGLKLKAWTDARDKLRTEYRAKVQSGELEPRGRMANLMAKAKGHPDRADVQAARRMLIKRGYWTDQLSDAADARFTTAGHEAVATASMGSIGKDTRILILANDYEEERQTEGPEPMPKGMVDILAKIERAGGRAKYVWYDQLKASLARTNRAGDLRAALSTVQGAIMSRNYDSVQRAVDTFRDYWEGAQVQ